jgi:hypothetical protein
MRMLLRLVNHLRDTGYGILQGCYGGNFYHAMAQLYAWYRIKNYSDTELYARMRSQASIECKTRFPNRGELKEFLDSSRMDCQSSTCMQLLANYLHADILVTYVQRAPGPFQMEFIEPTDLISKHRLRLGCVLGRYFPVVPTDVYGRQFIYRIPVLDEQMYDAFAYLHDEENRVFAERLALDDKRQTQQPMKEQHDKH